MKAIIIRNLHEITIEGTYEEVIRAVKEITEVRMTESNLNVPMYAPHYYDPRKAYDPFRTIVQPPENIKV
jgi:hypothetical protein